MRLKHRSLHRASIEAAGTRYRAYPVAPLSYGTVRDYCDSYDHLRPLATACGDLKDLQRPWMLKAILASVGSRGARLLEIGAGEPLVADLLRRSGHEVWVVDPYDGSGNGPRDFAKFRLLYPGLKFVREVFTESTSALTPGSFDCIYSISVLEHVPSPELVRAMDGVRKFLKPDGVSIHAVDHVHRGAGAKEHLDGLALMATCLGSDKKQLDHMLAEMSGDTETYYLSAEGHNRWRGALPYDEFPMRVCVSVQFRCQASDLVIPRNAG
jgi:SAM-dependent methyltransferase